ncbi:MAG: class I SAM-dependent methyltransferase [bacterium]|nr:class I SAM-dependent methyltransferase [bacterium]
MDQKFLRRLSNLYKKSDQLLASGRFGEGLWPLDAAVGQLLHYVILFKKLKKGLEVGAGVGYSSSWFISAFHQTKGKLVGLEYFLPKVGQLEKHLQQLFGSAYVKTADVVPSEFTQWLKKSGRGKFDFVFFDQRKMDYLPHLKLLIPRLKKGAYICADNVVSHYHECEEYLRFLRRDKRFQTVTLELGQGLEISRYVGENTL